MAIKTKNYKSKEEPKVIDEALLKNFLIWQKDFDLKYRPMQYNDKDYLLDDVPVTIEEIINKYKEDES